MRLDRYKNQAPKKKKSRTLKVLLLLILLLIVAIPASIYYSYNSALDSLFMDFTESDSSYEVGTALSVESATTLCTPWSRHASITFIAP